MIDSLEQQSVGGDTVLQVDGANDNHHQQQQQQQAASRKRKPSSEARSDDNSVRKARRESDSTVRTVKPLYCQKCSRPFRSPHHFKMHAITCRQPVDDDDVIEVSSTDSPIKDDDDFSVRSRLNSATSTSNAPARRGSLLENTASDEGHHLDTSKPKPVQVVRPQQRSQVETGPMTSSNAYSSIPATVEINDAVTSPSSMSGQSSSGATASSSDVGGRQRQVVRMSVDDLQRKMGGKCKVKKVVTVR